MIVESTDAGVETRSEGDDQTAFLLAARLAIDDNALWCAQQAIGLDGSVLHLLNTRIAGNDAIFSSVCSPGCQRTWAWLMPVTKSQDRSGI